MDERDSTQKKLVDTTDDLMNAVAERQKLEKLQRELAAQIMKLKEVLAVSKHADNIVKTPPEGLEGEVTSRPAARRGGNIGRRRRRRPQGP